MMFSDVIEQAAYMAHGYCLLWKPWLIALHVTSDVLIAGSYFAIPAAIWIFVRRRQDFELKPVAWLFVAFISFCGLTHIIQGLTLWYPLYETQAYVKVATAIISAITAISLFPLIPKALAIPSPRQLSVLNEGLASEIASHRMTLKELQVAKEELETRVAQRTEELQQAKARFEALVAASSQMVWSSNARGEIVEDSPSWRAFTGQTKEEYLGRGWLDSLHPDDRDSISQAWAEAVRNPSMFSAEYRLNKAGAGWCWTEVKAVPLQDGDGFVREWVGMNTDIDVRRRSQEHVEFVMRELSHRTKNLIAVIYSMAHQAAKTSNVSDFLSDFSARLQGLARSHDLLVDTNWRGVPIDEHVQAQLEPFLPADNQRFQSNGPSLLLTPAATQALGLALHELSTNALKYGALHSGAGEIQVDWGVETDGPEPHFRMRWLEQSGGTQPKERTVTGFGSKVLTRVVPESLSGKAEYRFAPESLIWELKAPLKEVVAPNSEFAIRHV